HRERKARPGTLTQAARDRHVVEVAAAEIEGQHLAVVVAQLLELRAVVAVLVDPEREHLGRRLLADRAPRHVDGLRVDEEQREQESEHAENHEEPVGKPPHRVGDHYWRSRKNVTTPGVTIPTNATASAQAGQTIGRFHSSRCSRRSSGSRSTYFPVGSERPAGFMLRIQPWRSAYDSEWSSSIHGRSRSRIARICSMSFIRSGPFGMFFIATNSSSKCGSAKF